MNETTLFDFAPLFAPNLPPPAAKWNGFAKYNFIGGHNDADQLPLGGLIKAMNDVLTREGRTLATYGVASGPLGYRPLREFLAQSSSAPPASPAMPMKSSSPPARCRRSIS